MEMANLIEHVFVLMLENRACDHMLGFSGITGHDAANGSSTQINGVTGSEVNTLVGIRLTHQTAIPSMRGWKTILGT
jgi:phospholipase C